MKRGRPFGLLQQSLEELEEQLGSVEDDDQSADHVDDPKDLVVELGGEEGDQDGDAQKPQTGGGGGASMSWEATAPGLPARKLPNSIVPSIRAGD